MKTANKGFNLIELMITMAIISVLAGVALPAYQHYVTKSKLTVLVDESAALSSTLYMYLADWGTFGGHSAASSIGLQNLNHNLEEVVTTLNNDPYFKVKNIWSGQNNERGLTVHVITETERPITGGGASEFYVHWDMTGQFIGINPAFGASARATNQPWWPNNVMGAAEMTEKMIATGSRDI